MAKLLEIIVTSVAEAREAEAGGADRLELVRNLEDGGLTPHLDLVRAVLDVVSVPVRVMLRENAEMSAGRLEEQQQLCLQAARLAAEPIDGFVAGFVEGGQMDLTALHSLLQAAPSTPFTFHRAFEALNSPEASLPILASLPQIDRVLVRAGQRFPLPLLSEWQAAVPRIRFIAGIGLSSELIEAIARAPFLSEVHAGRLVREPQTVNGSVHRARVAALKSALL